MVVELRNVSYSTIVTKKRGRTQRACHGWRHIGRCSQSKVVLCALGAKYVPIRSWIEKEFCLQH